MAFWNRQKSNQKGQEDAAPQKASAVKAAKADIGEDKKSPEAKASAGTPALAAQSAKIAAKEYKDTGNAYKILRKPLISEKSSHLATLQQYAFVCSPKANKIEVRKAVEKAYGVEVVQVNMMNMAGKLVRYGRSSGKRSNWKKALVTLKQGQKIDLYEGV